MGRFRSITHPFAARQHVLLHLLPLDLHVLGTPPAFNLSQDQTLHLKISTIIKKSGSKMAPTYCWTFWSLGLFRQRLKTRVPTQITCQTFKEHPRALGLGRAEKYTSTECLAHSLAAPPHLRRGAARAAQYSPHWRVVNAWVWRSKRALGRSFDPRARRRSTLRVWRSGL